MYEMVAMDQLTGWMNHRHILQFLFVCLFLLLHIQIYTAAQEICHFLFGNHSSKTNLFLFLFCCCCCPIIHADFTYILSLPGHSSQHAYPQPHQRSILHSVQKVRLGRHEIPVDSFQRRVFTAAKSLWWCSLMPVLI